MAESNDTTSQLLMTEKTDPSDSATVTDGRLRLVYVAGIALNVIALASAVLAGELLFAGTFVLVLAYLCFRYWTTFVS